MSSINSSGGATNYILELVVGLIAAVVLYFALGSFQLLTAFINRLEANRVHLLPYTYVMDTGPKQIIQNPNLNLGLTAYPSSNEATGIEFSYSFFLNVPQQAFDTTATNGLRHIFHKGSPLQYPLLGPGVYMLSNVNTLRVYMNSSDTWNNSVDVDNFPIGKWCHVVILCRSMHLEIYVNGNISSRLGFNLGPPYQNYGDIYAFSNQKPALRPQDTQWPVVGSCKGQLSNLSYFNYALSYSEINKLMNEGPSSYIDQTPGSTATTYLVDNWWTADFTQ
jgi:hypothetical protein